MDKLRIIDCILQVLLDHIKSNLTDLIKIRESFNYINLVYRNWLELELQSQIASPPNVQVATNSNPPPVYTINQEELYENVFICLDTEDQLGKLEWVLTAYMTSLSELNIPASHNINELLITTLVGLCCKVLFVVDPIFFIVLVPLFILYLRFIYL